MSDSNIPNGASPGGEILVIEDNLVELEVLCNVLREAGYGVHVSKGGEEGLRQVQECPPDLILLDVLTEGLEGLEICRRLKANPCHHEIPIIFLTALQSSEDKLKGLRAGAADYITKPCLKEEVLARVRTHLELRRTQLRLAEMIQQGTEAFRDSEGRVSAGIVISYDISERKRAEEAPQQQFRFQELLTRIATSYINLPLEAVETQIQVSLGEMSELVEADRAHIFDYDFSSQVINGTHEWCREGVEAQTANFQKIPIGTMPEWDVGAHRHGEPICIPDVLSLPPGTLRDLLERAGSKTLLAVPLMSAGECIGFVNFGWIRQHHVFSGNEQHLLTVFAHMLVSIRRRKQVEEALQRQFRFQELLTRIAATYINLPLEAVEAQIQVSLGEMSELVEADRAHIFEYDFPNKITNCTHEWCREGIEAEIATLKNVPLLAMSDWEVTAHRRGEPICIPDVLSLPPGVLRDMLEHGGSRTLLAVPLMSAGECIGFVNFGWIKQQHDFSGNEQHLLMVFAHMLVNIRRRKQAEEALQESERKARAIFDVSFGFIGLLSPEGVLLEANQTALEFAGVTLPEVVGKAFWECPWWNHDPAVQERLRTAITAAAEGRLVRFKTTNQSADGELHTIDFSLKPVLDDSGRVALLIPEGRDITEREQMEEALQLSLTQLRANLENTPNVAIQWFDEAGRVQYWNPASEAMYGWKAEEAMRKTLDELVFSPEEAADFLRILQAVRDTGEPFGPSEFRVHRRDGSEGWVMSTTFAIPMGEGRMGFACMDVDITERRRAEEGKLHLQAQLLQSQKMEVVGRLAGGVAHDFNNMLGVILGRADMAMNLVRPEDRIHSSLLEIRKAAQHSADLTRQLLAFARKQTVEPRILDLNDIVAGMLKMLRRLIGEDIDLVWVPSEGLWSVRMDPSQVDQVLANLCVNARDAIHGVGRIRIETQNVVLDAEYCATHFGAVLGDYILLTVGDDGCGMGAETLKHIFEPFFTTKGLGQGTGLGLATVYGIVQQNKGFIDVTSEPGNGSRFRIYLPRADAEGAVTPSEKTLGMSRGYGETLLLVEDDMGLRRLSCEALATMGYWVLAAGSPEEALRMAEASLDEIRMLISDVVMPGMNGWELAEILCKRKPGLKCLFVSGYTADIISGQSILSKGKAFLEKPFSMQSLTAKVREMLESE